MTASLAAMLTVALACSSSEPVDDRTAAPSAVAVDTAKSVRVAVLPLRVDGLTLNEVQRLDVLVRARVEMRGGMHVQAKDTTNKLVDSAQALGLDCELSTVACAAQLGRLADVSFVIAGEAVGLGDDVGLEMRIIDVESASVRQQVRALLPADADAQLEPLGAFFSALFDDDAALSALAVTAEPEGASLTVDGLAAGSLPLAEAIPGLLPGEHVVVASKDGYLPAAVRLQLGTETATTHTLRLEIDPSLRAVPPTPLELALPLVATGVSVALGALGVAATAYGMQPWLTFQQTQAELFERNQTSASYPTDAQRLHGDLEGAAAEWNENGRYWTGAGATLALVGLAASVGTTAWSVAVITRAFDAAAIE